VHVFRAETRPPPGILRHGLESMESMLRAYGDRLNFAEGALLDEYFRVLYGKCETDQKGVQAEREAEEQEKKQAGQRRTMGRKEIVPYALYRAHGFVSPHLAAQTGFSEQDLELLWQSLQQMFEHDRSAARGQMATRGLYIFEHESALGNAPAHRLFDRIQIERRDPSTPARDFAHYDVRVNEEGLPAGVQLHQWG
jgi:CRISPR-associated protein Cas7/Csd2 subtype I-C